MAEVKLASPIKVSGAEVDKLEMREPKVRDMLAADKSKGSDAEKEIAMFAALCEVTPDEIQELSMKDYTAVQKVYESFLS